MNDQAIVKAALEEFLRLPSEITGRVLPEWESGYFEKADPIDKPNKGIRHFRIRLLPAKPRLPRKFWTKSWCFYEMNVGAYEGSAARCEVQFFMGGNNSACSSGKYNDAVDPILSAVSRKRSDAEHISIYWTPYAHLRIRNKIPDPARMAGDMAWIIENTLDQFESIPSV